MTQIVRFFIRYPIWEKVLLGLIVIFGLLGLSNMKSSFFAPIDPREISIRLTYPGASPEEIEQSMVLKIEDNLKGIKGIERSTSVSEENRATIRVEVKKGQDVSAVLEDVKNAVNLVNSYPDDAEEPIVVQEQIIDFAIGFSISGDVPLKTLKRKAQEAERELLDFPEISRVAISGLPDEEIEVRVREARLQAYGLTIGDIGAAIRRANLDLTGGILKENDQQLVIRARNKSSDPAVISDIIVRVTPRGERVRVKDVATVSWSWADYPVRMRFNGQPAVGVQITKTVDEDILAITNRVRDYIDEFENKNPGLSLDITNDGSIILKQRIALLTKNGLMGALLVLLVLSFFLQIRLAFWVAVGIPISFLGMFLIGGMTGLTINVISLFGMIVVVGLLVDDAIVIGESIYRHVELGFSAKEAALKGTITVFPSVFSAVITTVIAFTPFFFLDGRIADVMNNMAIVVIVTLLVSLIEGALILPTHLAHSKGLKTPQDKSKLRSRIESWQQRLRNQVYGPILYQALRHRVVTIGVPILLFGFTIYAMKMGVIKATFFPFIDRDTIEIKLTMPVGAREEATWRALAKIEKAVWQVNQAFKRERPDKKDVVLNVTRQMTGLSHKGQLSLRLLDGETRNQESFYITQAIRKKVGVLPEAESVEYGNRGFFGQPVSISLTSHDFETLNQIRSKLVAALKQMPALKDVTQSDQAGLPELQVDLTPQAEFLGLTRSDVLTQIRHGYYGMEVQRLLVGSEEVKIWVRYDPIDRFGLGPLDYMTIRGSNQTSYPLAGVATVSRRTGPISINHVDGRRQIKVEARLTDQKDPLPPILNQIKAETLAPLLAQYPAVQATFDGQKRQTDKTAQSGKIVLPMTLVAMFCVIILAFRSVGQAIVLMMILPFGFIGVAWGHAIHGFPISILSIFGIIALVGIMVNDGIVLVNAFNRFLREGRPFRDALFQAGLTRFRPIILTSITTIAGLGPLIAEKSRQAQFLIPMAISVAYGLLITTFLILLVLPALLSILNSIRRLIAMVRGLNAGPEAVEPAVKECMLEL